ncbi:MAG: hypothetical protein GF330_14895 [Candidatus Eisenbacteria bacterium]|nr:hypothetical protein [Candidatus Eisenbacteria bacterium]
MFLMDLVFAIIIGVVLSVVLVSMVGWRHPARGDAWPSAIFAFVTILLVAWAGAVWLAPVGPGPWYAHWWPALAVGVGLALLLLALAPPTRRPPTTREAESDQPPAQTREVARVALFGAFFWALIVALAIAVVAAYLVAPAA